MRILYKWENCPLAEKEKTFYYIEHPIEEVNVTLLSLMSKNDSEEISSGSYIWRSNQWVKMNPELAKSNCIYYLISEDVKTIILRDIYFPYSSLWNGYSPLIPYEKDTLFEETYELKINRR